MRACLILSGCVCALLAIATDAAVAQRGARPAAPYLSLAEIHRVRGRDAESAAVLERLDVVLAPRSPSRSELAEAFVNLGRLEQAASVWERMIGAGVDPAGTTMKLARVREKLGRNAEALATWRTLWRQPLSDAQRNVVMERITSLADTEASLQETASELEARSRSGSGNRHDALLLIRLYVTAAQRASDDASRQSLAAAALHAVDEFLPRAGVGDLEVHRQRAQVYRALGNPQELEHEIVKAGLIEDPVVGYRRAVATAPDVADNHLMLADALRKRGRVDEAFALSQWLASAAPASVAFVASMDALLNLTSARLQEDPTGRSIRPVLRWSQRQVLERLTSAGQTRYLYPLQAEFAESARNPLQSFLAIESLLPLARESRSALLRQLIGLASPVEGDFETETEPRGLIAGGDAIRVRLGRRLLGLREALPPHVYVDVGRDLLTPGDEYGAARAFALARAEEASSELLERIAQSYESVGRDAPALSFYREALAADASNIALMSRLAGVLGRLGFRDEAHRLHGVILLAVLSRLPTASSAPGERTSYEFRTFYEPALRGYLATWPDGSPRIDGFIQLLATETQASEATEVSSLSSRPRLEKTAAFLRTIYFATGNAAEAERVAGEVGQLEAERVSWGYSLPTRRSALSFDLALERAERTLLYGPPLGLSVLNGDQDQMLAAARSWAGAASGGAALEAVDWASSRLDARRLAMLCREVAKRIREDADVWLQMWGGGEDSRALESIERALGEPLFTSAEWMERIDNHPLSGNYLPARRARYLVARLSPEDRVRLLQRMAAQPEPGLSILPVWRELLKTPVSPESATQIQAAMRTLFETMPGNLARHAAEITGKLIEADQDVRNFPLARAVMQDWREHSNADLSTFEALALLRSGRTQEAIAALAQATAAITATMARADVFERSGMLEPVRAVRRAFVAEHAEQLRAHLDRAAESDAWSAEARVHLFDPGSTIADLRHAVDLNPANEALLVRLQALYQRSGALADAILMLERLQRVDDVEPVYRGYLYAAYLAAGRASDASRLNDSSPEDMSHPTFLSSLPLRQQMSKNPLVAALEPTFRPSPAPRSSPDAEALEDELRSAPIEEEESLADTYRELADAYAQNGKADLATRTLFERVRRGAANVRETTLWMALLADDVGSRRVDESVALALDAQLQTRNEISRFRLLLMARLYAASGRMQRALQVYHLAAGRSLGWEADVLGVIEEGDKSVMSATELLRQAKRHLDATTVQAFTTSVMRLMDPGPAATAVMREAHRRFLLEIGVGTRTAESAQGSEEPEPSDAMSEQKYLKRMTP